MSINSLKTSKYLEVDNIHIKYIGWKLNIISINYNS